MFPLSELLVCFTVPMFVVINEITIFSERHEAMMWAGKLKLPALQSPIDALATASVILFLVSH